MTKLKQTSIFLIIIGFLLIFISFRAGQNSFILTQQTSLQPTPKELDLAVEKVKRSLAPVAHTTPPSDPTKPWIETLCWSPRIFLYHNFITEEECNSIIELGGNDVARSKVVSEDGKGQESTARTSHGTFLTDKYIKKSPLLRNLEKRIAEWTQLPVENGEAFYLLRYDIGQEYKPHTDWFQSDSVGQKHIGTQGNRYATVITYLRSPEEGGETTFPHAKINVKAKQGDAVLFWDLTPWNEGDKQALHGSVPVVKGLKWALTKWIREKKTWRYDDNMTDEEKKQLEKEDKEYAQKRLELLKSKELDHVKID